MQKSTITLMAHLFLAPSLYAGVVSLDDGNITFIAPRDFKVIPKEMIDIKFPTKRAPRYVIGNEEAATTIAYDLKPHKILPGQIDELRDTIADMFSRIVPGLRWIENKTIDLSGRKWGYLEMTSTAIDTDIHNIMLFTGYKKPNAVV